jgi:hypothetical protein
LVFPPRFRKGMGYSIPFVRHSLSIFIYCYGSFRRISGSLFSSTLLQTHNSLNQKMSLRASTCSEITLLWTGIQSLTHNLLSVVPLGGPGMINVGTVLGIKGFRSQASRPSLMVGDKGLSMPFI